MKFLINSKLLAEHVKLAVQFKAQRVMYNDNHIVFTALREIRMPIRLTATDVDLDIKFNQFRWMKVRDFATDLQDQELTVQLLEDRIMIHCEALFVV